MSNIDILNEIQKEAEYIKLRIDFNLIIIVSLFFSSVLCIILSVLNYSNITTLICLIFICISCFVSIITAFYRVRELKEKINYINEIMRLYQRFIEVVNNK